MVLSMKHIKVVALRAIKLRLKKRRKRRNRKPRQVYERLDYRQSTWWKFLQRPTIRDATHRDGKLFRLRFRVPYLLFEKLLWLCSLGPLADSFKQKKCDATGRPSIPLELKLLGVLRVLGRASCFDSIAELTNSEKEAHRVFFHKFVKIFVEKLFDHYVCPPTSDESISQIMRHYDRVGFTGCVGSVDCVHIPWNRCPAKQLNLYTGKEGYPTIAYEVVCDHTLRILSATAGHYGSRNDKTIVRFDGFINALKNKKLFGNISFEIMKNSSDAG